MKNLNIPLNGKTIGTAAALVALVVVYALFADYKGVMGGALAGAGIGCVVSGMVGLYRWLFVLKPSS